MANFEALRPVISSSINLLFLKSVWVMVNIAFCCGSQKLCRSQNLTQFKGSREGDANCKLKYKIDQIEGVKCKLYATNLPTSKNSNSSKPNSLAIVPYFIVSGNVGICHIPFISPDMKTR